MPTGFVVAYLIRHSLSLSHPLMACPRGAVPGACNYRDQQGRRRDFSGSPNVRRRPKGLRVVTEVSAPRIGALRSSLVDRRLVKTRKRCRSRH